MKLSTIQKLCVMIDHTYKIILSFFNEDGIMVISSADLKESEKLAGYLEQTHIMVAECMRQHEILIRIDEFSLTWMVVPVIEEDNKKGYLVLGPFYSHIITESILMNMIYKAGIDQMKKSAILNYHSLISYYPYQEYVKIIKVIYFYLYENEFDESKLGVVGQNKMMAQDEERRFLIDQSDVMEPHGTYLFERCMLECVRLGDLQNLKTLMLGGTKGKAGAMIVGNEMRQAKDLFIVTTAIVARAAIEGGINCESAYSISDLYIQQVEMMKSLKDINEHSMKMLMDFTGRVHEVLRINAYSYYVNQCCDYITTHVCKSISVAHIADVLKISQEHLSRSFKSETGMAVVDYIKKVKVKEAKFLLKFTDLSLVEISQKLAFSSQSHFNTTFKSEMELTPKQYRDRVKLNKQFEQ